MFGGLVSTALLARFEASLMLVTPNSPARLTRSEAAPHRFKPHFDPKFLDDHQSYRI